ncbi:hypothetical protein [Pseudomonas sp. R3-18-08]|uniref:hypothetical protein n=1 Tax=Pseudomonas sp. R3-18-08 TaxID=1173283 RepID=UPI0021142648|nr:hypothetical protein [Pseudomonas sp. R3-18-08]
MMLMLREEGQAREIFVGFLVYLISHSRPMAELLAPRWKPLAGAFQAEFAGMTREPVTLGQLEATRESLLTAIRQQFNEQDAAFLISIEQGESDWKTLNLPGIDRLPAVQWKLHNVRQIPAAKRMEAVAKLETVVERLLAG